MIDHQHVESFDQNNRSFGLGILLNLGYVIVETVFGFLSGSLALLADAGHNASDLLGLGLAWGANLLAQRPFDQRHTYGWRSVPILAALFNGLILLGAAGFIVYEAVKRLTNPEPQAASMTMFWVALAGTVIGLASAWIFRSGRKEDLNVRGAFIHMISDAGVSAGVVLAALIIRYTNWNWLDPAVSLVIAGVIFWGTWGLLRQAFHLLVGGVPPDVDLEQVRAYLSSLPGVQNVHDLHIWGLSTREIALTAHLVKPEPDHNDHLIEEATEALHERFDIDHVTLQWERERLSVCS